MSGKKALRAQPWPGKNFGDYSCSVGNQFGNSPWLCRDNCSTARHTICMITIARGTCNRAASSYVGTQPRRTTVPQLCDSPSANQSFPHDANHLPIPG